MGSFGERLRAFWLSQGLALPPGVPEDRLEEFQKRLGVILPADFRDYFLHVDGMGSRGEQFDNDFFAFWPLGEVVRASSEFEGRFIEEQSAYFLFADHSLMCPSFAIHLTPAESDLHPVIAIYSDRQEYSTSVVARSFAEFANRYLDDESSRFDLRVGVPFEC